MKKKTGILLGLCVAAAGVYFAAGRPLESRNGGAEESKDIVYVNSVSDITGEGMDYAERFGGVIEPQATVKVKLDAEKKVKECRVKEGEQVEEGQVLFVYDTREDENKLAQLEIDIEKEKSEIESTKAAIARLEKEKRSAGADDQLAYTTDILTQQNNIKMSEYEIKTKTLEMEQLRETLQNAEVKSEVSGMVQKINPPDSDDMSNSDGTYIKILKAGDFRIKCKLNEQNLPMVTEGMSVVIFSRLDKNQKWKGTVTEVVTDNTQEDDSEDISIGGSSSGSSNYHFYVQVQSTDGMLLGQHVYLEEDKGQDAQKEGLWLPENYLIQENGKFFVWKADESQHIRRQEVTTGGYDEEQGKYQIVSGLTTQDSIAFPMDSIREESRTVLNEYDGDADAGNADSTDNMDEENTGVVEELDDDADAEVVEEPDDDVDAEVVEEPDDDADAEVVEEEDDDAEVIDDADAEVIEETEEDSGEAVVWDDLGNTGDIQE
ncbi:efflux transporter, RND family, MFP subunit [Marvinbryantia formatexigens DSM 14469]|uniref:Efflux transporter, RND family, MFP subunit n=1 Tax=Marvinbryantia formatexigens DSM 14469 TaxID=478749 RepID=C6L9G7_9FIRM|nr:biotin/lipoyl-binding protein [Marvinbryantia formatexigens]EET62906.1 efflux transporter, RND family, MFP subunit [Marvinbryantia formatexigens DSM 14469]UWO23500.1 biotin/lipoyl-binding protein [Marvinbryantia formatexigens DSM 14469]SDG56254.1 HlyD family secretion protein [Marvinbryantia formatexigens]